MKMRKRGREKAPAPTEWLLAAPGCIESRLPRSARPSVPGEALVEVSRISLCGSDYKLFQGHYGGPRQYPLRFGHEWAGRVLEAAPGNRLAAGTRVTGDCSRWCGDCGMCAVDRNLCRDIEKFGITVDGFSTRQRLVEERYLYVADPGLGDEALALVELFAVALRGIQRAMPALEAAREVLIVGAGPLGLAIWLLLSWGGRGDSLHVIEASPEKAACILQRFPGLALVPGPSPTAGPRSYGELARSARYAVVFECSGASGGLEAAALAAAPRGTVVCLGLGAGAAAPTELVVTKGLTLVGSIGGTGCFPEAMHWLAAHEEEAVRLVTHRFPADLAARAFQETVGSPARIKVQLLF